MEPDKLIIEITPQGLFKVETDQVGEANHSLAEGLIAKMAELAGGKTTRTLKPNASLAAALHAHCADGHTHGH